MQYPVIRHFIDVSGLAVMATLSVQGTAHCTDVCIYTVLMYLSWTNVSTLGSSIYIRQIYLHWINLFQIPLTLGIKIPEMMADITVVCNEMFIPTLI